MVIANHVPAISFITLLLLHAARFKETVRGQEAA
jgi:hypothetical protein